MNTYKKKSLLWIKIFFLIACVNSAYSQNEATITNVVAIGVPVCKPTSINVQFTATNGKGPSKQFTALTDYTIELGIVTTQPDGSLIFTPVPSAAKTFQSVTTPIGNNGSAIISTSFDILDNVPDGVDYQLLVTATNPDPGTYTTQLSNTFEVKPKPIAPGISNNGPVCVGSTLELYANTVANATYYWSGPNGFTSNDQNPVVSTNATTSMSGDYSLYITTPGSGCTSPVTSMNVVVSSAIYWTGSVSNDWNDPANWNCGSLPDLTTPIIIESGLSTYPVIYTGATAKVKDLTLKSGASLTIQDNFLEIAGSIINNGSIDSAAGGITLNGTTTQSIPADTFLNNRLNNLIIINPAHVDLTNPLEVTGIVKAETGNLNSNGFLTLVSDSVQTALIDGSGGGEVMGTVNIQRYLANSFGYKYFSSPFSNSTVGDFSSYIDLNSTFPHFYSYNEARETENNEDVSGWTAYTTATNPVNILEGYALNFGNATAPLTVEISGEVNNGAYYKTLQNSNGLYTNGFNLVGNPYPSPIDWNAPSGWTKQNIDDAIYFFTASTSDQYSGTYTSYVNGISSSPVSSEGIIPSMQGFFVKVSDGFSTGNLGLTNEARSLNFDQEFYKKPEEKNYPISTASLIRLSARFEEIASKDAAVIYFSTANRPEFEKDKDALKLMNTDAAVPNIYSLDPENKRLSINGTGLNTGTDIHRIPLGIQAKQSGWIHISLDTLEHMDTGLIYLLDKQKRTGQDLRKNKVFKFYTEAGTQESRFELLFSQNPITDPAEAFEDPLRINNKNGQVFAEFELKSTEAALLQAINLNGQILDQYNVLGAGSIEIKGIKSSGLYLFSLVTSQGRYSKKVLIRL